MEEWSNGPAVWWGVVTTVGMAAFGVLVFANAALQQLIRMKARLRALFGEDQQKRRKGGSG